MPTETHPMFSSKPALWIGYVMAAVSVLLLVMSGVMKVTMTPVATEGFVHLGYPEGLALGIGIVELACLVLVSRSTDCRAGRDLADWLSGRRHRQPCPHWGAVHHRSAARRGDLGQSVSTR